MSRVDGDPGASDLTERVLDATDEAMRSCEHMDATGNDRGEVEWGRVAEGACPVCPDALDRAGYCACCGWGWGLSSSTLTLRVPLGETWRL